MAESILALEAKGRLGTGPDEPRKIDLLKLDLRKWAEARKKGRTYQTDKMMEGLIVALRRLND